MLWLCVREYVRACTFVCACVLLDTITHDWYHLWVVVVQNRACVCIGVRAYVCARRLTEQVALDWYHLWVVVVHAHVRACVCVCVLCVLLDTITHDWYHL